MLQWLVYLLCPLMMLGCMLGLLRPGLRGETPARTMSIEPGQEPRSPREEIAYLRAAQEDLAQRIESLAARIEEPEAITRPRRVAGSAGR